MSLYIPFGLAPFTFWNLLQNEIQFFFFFMEGKQYKISKWWILNSDRGWNKISLDAEICIFWMIKITFFVYG